MKSVTEIQSDSHLVDPDSNATEPTRSPLFRFLPYAFSLVGLLIGYFGTRVFGFGMLAVVMAAIGAVLGYTLCRIVQARGQVSLVVTAILFPSLAAILCVAFLNLAPYRNRHRGIEQLRAAQMTITLRPPGQQNEWLIDQSGNMVPIWLANVIGPECLSELRGLEGELEGLERVDLSLLDTSSLGWAGFTRSMPRGPSVSNELVAWLNQCENYRKNSPVQFTLADYRPDDGKALAKLNQRLMLMLQNSEQLPDLSDLSGVELLFLSGARLTPDRASQLPHIAGLRFLRLNLMELESDTIKALSGLSDGCYLTIEKTELDAESLTCLAKLGVYAVELNDCQLKDLGGLIAMSSTDEAAFEETPKLQYLRLAGSLQSYEDCYRLASLFRCETLSIMDLSISKSDPLSVEADTLPELFFDLDSPEVETLWKLPHLQKIECNTGGWRTLERPADGDRL